MHKREVFLNTENMKIYLVKPLVVIFSIWGVHFGFRHFMSQPRVPFKKSLTTADELLLQIGNAKLHINSQSDKEDIVRIASSFVHHHTWHCEPSNYELTDLEKLLRLSFSNNLFDQGLLDINRIDCGFCHQRAYILKVVLEKFLISSRVYGLSGHVVLKVDLGDEVFFADPDYGVDPIPFSKDAIIFEQSLKEAYSRFGNRDTLASMYLTTNNNEYYHPDPEGLKNIDQKQSLFFLLSSIAALLLIVTGLVLVAALLKDSILRIFRDKKRK